MLVSRNLDDQSFEDIVQYAVSRLPWLCPDWTNHNASDPGITIIELMAWYKEMQQYHMNRFTDDMKRKLLTLLGVRPRPASAAVCGVMPEGRREAPLPALSRLETPEGIAFELEEEIPAAHPRLTACFTGAGEGFTDISDMLGRRGIGIAPFRFGGVESSLYLGFEAAPGQTLRLWFDVDAGEGPERNEFLTPRQQPRVIRWSVPGGGETQPVFDETHALSRSGYLALTTPGDWALTAPWEGAPEAYWLRAELIDPGCEETVRITGLTAERYRAIQRETWAAGRLMTVRREKFCRAQFTDALAAVASFTAFLRTEEGWSQITEAQEIADKRGRGLRFDSRAAVRDGEPNLMVVCTDPIHYHDLFFDSDGLPGMTLCLSLGERRALTESFTLICDSLDEDGKIRPALWRCTEDFYSCGPRDRVFTYDPLSESITFGDGRHGAIVPRGKAAVLVSGLELSRCGGGNIPAGHSLVSGRGDAFRNTAASGGAEEESVSAAGERFLRMLGRSEKCVSAEDYERAARSTPGLRVAAAKAIPGYDPDEPSGKSDRPVVTVVVIPFSQSERPMPDRRFLDAVRAHMDAHRPICTVVRVVPPKYVGIGASVQLRTRGGLPKREVADCIERYLAVGGGRSIGDPVVRGDLAMELQKLPGVLKVGRVELRPLGPDCYVADGDISIPRNAVAYLRDTEVDLG